MAESRFGALKGLRTQVVTPAEVPESIEPERPQVAGAGESGELRRGPGRPKEGKRSNPDYERLNLLVRKTTRHKVNLRMLNEPKAAADISELVDRLLSEWAAR